TSTMSIADIRAAFAAAAAREDSPLAPIATAFMARLDEEVAGPRVGVFGRALGGLLEPGGLNAAGAWEGPPGSPEDDVNAGVSLRLNEAFLQRLTLSADAALDTDGIDT